MNIKNNGSSALYDLYMRDVLETKLLTPEKALELATKTMSGDGEARLHFIKANLLLVVKIAHGFEGRGLPILDLINEGNVGLIKAINRYDPTKGGKLSTYATFWISRHMINALEQQVWVVRLPRHIQWCGRVMDQTLEKLRRKLEREPTELELANELQISEDRLAQVRGYHCKQVSFDESASTEPGSATFHERIADERAVSPYVSLDQKSRREIVDRLIETLTPREKMVMEYRFGLKGQVLTLESIAKMIPCTKERIRQIESAALRKLRLRFAELERSTRKLNKERSAQQSRDN